MLGRRITTGLGLAASLVAAGLLAGTAPAGADPGSLVESLVGGSRGTGETMPNHGGGIRLYDPDAPACPTVTIRDGGSALQAYAGSVGDGGHLRHQIKFARISRSCTPRPDGSVAVKVGLELRGLLGPAGAPGTFDGPVTVAVKVGDRVLEARSRRVPVTVPPGAAQGLATVIEDGLVVPAGSAGEFDIEVALASPPRAAQVATHPAAHARPKVAARRRDPAAQEASAQAPAAAGSMFDAPAEAPAATNAAMGTPNGW